MGASGNKKIGFDLLSDGSEWLIVALASTTTYETGFALGKGGPGESDADHRATMGRFTSLLASVAAVKFDGAAMSTLDSTFSGFPTHTTGPFPNVAPGTWWSQFTSAEKTAWVDHIWKQAKRLRL